MSEIYLFFFFLFDIIFLQPLKIVIAIVYRFLWNPSVDGKYISSVMSLPDVNIDKNEIHREVTEFDTTPLQDDGDGFKWITILLGQLKGKLGYLQKYNELLDVVNKYLWNNGTIGRYPVGHAKRYETSNFSGDMLSGLMFWLSRESQSEIPFGTVPNDIMECLKKVFEVVTFSRESGHGNKKRLLCFSNAREEVTDYDSLKEDRGYIYRFWGLSPDLVRLLVWLKLGYLITGQKRFLFFYRMIRIGFAPLFCVSRGDYGIFVGKLMAVAWFTSHSNMYHLTSLYLLTKETRWKKIAKGLRKDFWWNPDISGAYFTYFLEGTADSDIGDFSRYYHLVERALRKGSSAPPLEDSHTDYFDLRKFTKVQLSPYWLLPQFIGHRYMWENNPIKYCKCDEERRRVWIVDRLVAALYHT